VLSARIDYVVLLKVCCS